MVKQRTGRTTKSIRATVAGRTRRRRAADVPPRVAPDDCIRTASRGAFTLKAYRGDGKTLLAFNLPKARAVDLAGFTIQCRPRGQPAYYLHNMLRFEHPEQHAQDEHESAHSSINAPIHKFRWVHVPGLMHQGAEPCYGPYTYTVTPRYFDRGALKPLDPELSASLEIEVAPFQTGALELGFTRGTLQSQTFVKRFGKSTAIQPRGRGLIFDTSQVAGIDGAGRPFTYEQMYAWLGSTARARLMAVLDQVASDSSLRLDMFAYDLRDPRVVAVVLRLARQGRIRLILDNAALHHDPDRPKLEDRLEAAFRSVARKGARMVRGRFGQYAHDKVLIVSRGGAPLKVLTGSTNFSVTGLYVNSNHVIVFNDPGVAAAYAAVFEVAWNGRASRRCFVASPLATRVEAFSSRRLPRTEITFSPHPRGFACALLRGIASRIAAEARKVGGSVLFALMQLDRISGPVFPALEALHADRRVFSYGISDTPRGIQLYTRGKRTGVLTTGKPTGVRLPPPFCELPSIGIEHQIHHKFIVCGFNGADPVVYCGSSNLAGSSEIRNGDNLLAIRDRSVAVVFAIEALGLVDHFNFLDRCATRKPGDRAAAAAPPATQRQAAARAGWFLSTRDRWAAPYYDPRDLHCIDRVLFG